jgi:hypothetical protein
MELYRRIQVRRISMALIIPKVNATGYHTLTHHTHPHTPHTLTHHTPSHTTHPHTPSHSTHPHSNIRWDIYSFIENIFDLCYAKLKYEQHWRDSRNGFLTSEVLRPFTHTAGSIGHSWFRAKRFIALLYFAICLLSTWRNFWKAP